MEASINTSSSSSLSAAALSRLAHDIRQWAQVLGFADCRISALELGSAPQQLRDWLARGWHGDMEYLARHAELRADPTLLLPAALRAICVTMPYLSDSTDWREREWQALESPLTAQVSLYARGRDYHKVLRTRLQTLAERIAQVLPHEHRVFTDSAPVMEVELARQAGIGWRGKHTLLLNRHGGSMFFLGEILTSLPLPVDEPGPEHCGSGQACLDIGPTQAIVAPYQLDARRCISYLTIEHHGSIPLELRPLMGNRIYGCDDCQLVCPWNKYAQASTVQDFSPRAELTHNHLLHLWSWDEASFLHKTQGSAIRRIGYERWRRNLAVALGNALHHSPLSQIERDQIRTALEQALLHAGALVQEHITWALQMPPHNAVYSSSGATHRG
ncbi:MAG: tRNA epoxyqueuosine(34) reductase QueG [Burkholderiales bacterium]